MPFADKAPNMQNFLNQMARQMYGRTVSESLKQGICVQCAKPAVPALTPQHLAEYHISAMCSTCQDEVFEDSYDSEYDG